MMNIQPRLPQLSDFPASCHLSIIIPPQKNTTTHYTSALIILHGLGDSEIPFKHLAESLALPETVGISLRAPHSIPPFLTGSNAPAFHWSDDLMFDEQSPCIDGDGGFVGATKLLEEIITVLTHRCGFEQRDIWLLGFGQGAMAALGLVTKIERDGKINHDELGGVVAIGAGLPKETLTWKPIAASEKLKTPVLLCGGNKRTQVTKSVVSCHKDRFTSLRYIKWDKEGDGMPKNREEMLPIMEFFARRLRSRAGVPDGAVQL